MNHLLFILKTVIFSVLISGLLGFLSGILWSMIIPDHAHNPLPTWLATLVVAVIIALIIGIIVSSFLTFSKKANLKNALLYTNGIVFFIVIILLISMHYS